MPIKNICLCIGNGNWAEGGLRKSAKRSGAVLNPRKGLAQWFRSGIRRNVASSRTLHLKAFFYIVLVFTGTVLIMTYQVHQHMKNLHLQMTREELFNLATMAAQQIDGDLVEQLQKPQDAKKEVYRLLQRRLMRLKQVNTKIDDIYLMRKTRHPNQLAFIVNAYPTGENHVGLGEIYDLAQAPDMLRGFCGPAVDRKFTSDKWGIMLSGYAPVRNRHGHVIAIVGIDYTAQSLKEIFAKYDRQTLVLAGIGLLVFWGLSFFLARKMVARLNKIQYAIGMLLEGKYNVAIEDAGTDEIKVLASDVNKLIQKMVADKEEMLIHLTTGLVKALETRDVYTHGHSAQVAEITVNIMQELSLDQAQQFRIGLAAVLHDIGKIGIPDGLLHKPGKLTDEEFEIIRQHPAIGESILEGIPSLEEVRHIVRQHHERYDGNGYPDRLVGESIHLGARIIAVADSFQAMISDRAYRKGGSQELALQELARNRGTQFDPEIVDVFLGIWEREKRNRKIDPGEFDRGVKVKEYSYSDRK